MDIGRPPFMKDDAELFGARIGERRGTGRLAQACL
jgi:hypothetical protein